MSFPKLGINKVMRVGTTTPKLRSGERHRVKVLLAGIFWNVILETIHAMMPLNNTTMSARISRHPGVSRRVIVFDNHFVTDRELRRYFCRLFFG